MSSEAHGQVEEDDLPNKFGVSFIRKRGEMTAEYTTKDVYDTWRAVQ